MTLFLIIIGIAVVIISALNMILAAPILHVAIWIFPVLVVIATIYQILIDAIIAIILNLFHPKWLLKRKVFNVSKGEQRFLEKLGIRHWKNKVPELGRLGGFSKANVSNPNSPEYI